AAGHERKIDAEAREGLDAESMGLVNLAGHDQRPEPTDCELAELAHVELPAEQLELTRFGQRVLSGQAVGLAEVELEVDRELAQRVVSGWKRSARGQQLGCDQQISASRARTSGRQRSTAGASVELDQQVDALGLEPGERLFEGASIDVVRAVGPETVAAIEVVDELEQRLVEPSLTGLHEQLVGGREVELAVPGGLEQALGGLANSCMAEPVAAAVDRYVQALVDQLEQLGADPRSAD